jgi:hypothetical protein
MTYTQDPLKDQARSRARAILANSQSFRSMGESEQMALYKDVVDREYNQLYQENMAPLAQQSSLVSAMGERGASRDIDEARHENQRIEQVGKLGADFIQDVDFPSFVKDLLKGVFDANLQVTHQQMEDFSKMVAETTKSLSEFAKQFTDDDAVYHLAERQGDQFGLLNDDNSGKPVLTDRSGRAFDPDSTELKSRIMDAKLAMARERRALLREMLLMGVTRLVVEKGTVKAAVVFDVKATEKIEKADRSARNREATSGSTTGGGLGGLFSRQRSGTTKETRISISSAKSQSTTDMAANITGAVEIQFKTDYFKLDNFLQMYGGTATQAPLTPGQPNGQAPKPVLPPGQIPPPPR